LDQIGDLIGEAEEFYLGGFLVYVSSYVSIADHSRRYLDQIGDLIGEAEEFYLGGFLVYMSSYVSII
jgi:hypothetical protein